MADKEFKPPYTPIPSILLASTQLNESPSAWASRLAVYAHIATFINKDSESINVMINVTHDHLTI